MSISSSPEQLTRTPFDTLSINFVSDLLNKLTLPDFQRESDSEHVEKIYEGVLNQITKGKEPKLTGCLITVTTPETTYLLDGNHRLKAFAKLLKINSVDLRVYIQEIKTLNKEEAEALFNQANTSLPVAQMPEGIKRSSVNDVSLYFYKKYGGAKGKERAQPLFRDTVSGTVNRPRISRCMFEQAIGQILEFASPEEVITKLDQHIQLLNEKSTVSFKQNGGDTVKRLQTMLATADLFGCRLGMDLNPNYFSRLAEIIGINVKKQVTLVRTKERIPVALRVAVWNRYCGSSVRQNECPFCKDEIKLETFHCAHDLAESKSGETTINNLYPCCSSCNLSMGCLTFMEWRERWQ